MNRSYRRKGILLIGVLILLFSLLGCKTTTTGGTTETPTTTTPESSHVITFDWNYADETRTVNIAIGDPLTRPVDPVREGYEFIGWYRDADLLIPYEFSFVPADDLTIYAKWIVNTYTISYNDFNDEMSVKIVAGWNHNIALSPEGRVFTWGDNAYGQLGDGTTDPKSERVEITDAFDLEAEEVIIDIIAGGTHSFAVSSEGRVFAWGRNNYGQLGDGSRVDSLTPIDISAQIHLSIGDTILKLVAGGSQSFILTTKGKIIGWGANYVYQMGNNGTQDVLNPTNLTNYFTLQTEETIVDLIAGGNHTFAITSTNRIFAWGDNHYGQLGEGTNDPKITNVDVTTFFDLPDGETIESIVAGQFHTLALSSLGRIFTWGRNNYGQLGNDSTLDVYLPLDISARFNLNPETVSGIFAGMDQSFAIFEDEIIFAWGLNADGQLGNGTTTNQKVPLDISNRFAFTTTDPVLEIVAGGHHTLVRSVAGNVYAFGNNAKGQLGNGTDSEWLIPVEITDHFELGSTETILHLYEFGHMSFALTSLGRVFAYGDNTYGQLGDGTTITRSIPVEITAGFNLNSGETIAKITGGIHHVLALSSDGRVFTWGRNNFGQMGSDASAPYVTTPQLITPYFALQELGEEVIDIFSGSNHSFAVTDAEHVYAWGNNEYGQLGNDSEVNSGTPVNITTRFALASGESIIAMAGGASHSLALSSLGRVFSFGENSYGQLGNGTLDSSILPQAITIAFGLNGTDHIIALTAGEYFSGAVANNGQVFLWGNNAYYQLGDGTGINALLPLDISSELVLYALESVVSLHAGKAHTIALTSLGRVFVFGNNYYGQIGDGTTTFKPTPILISSRFGFQNEEVALNVSAGFSHSGVLTSTGRVLQTGDNYYGQLGIGDSWSPALILEGTPSEIGSQTFPFDAALSLLQPVKAGFTFGGWFLDQYLTEAFTKETMPGEDVMLYVKWIPIE